MSALDYAPSPVASDAFLEPGDLPFTAFGHLGRGNLDIRVFAQDTYWVDITGRAHLLDEMPLDYRVAVLLFCTDLAADFRGRMLAYAYSVQLRAEDAGVPVPDGLDVDVIRAMGAQEWLESTPLVARLRTLTGTRPAVQPA